ncbi:MAG: SDR family NAD(P)-dependent oxidoreductase [Hungatella sp.]|nr:SDR family NAD(P)-dependent oxidoreductase [Hungatella sp.]
MKIAVITGASSGMGREAAVQIADRFAGMDEVWLIARRKERLEELEGRLPARVRSFALDITSKDQRNRLREALEREKPDVKILVNAAGFGKIGKVGETDEDTECAMVRLNCESLCAVTHMVLPFMSPNSRIIQFASAASFLPQPKFAIYAATKSFVLSYSRALGAELKKRDIYVTAVCPGPVDTEFFDIAETSDQIPLYKRLVMANPKKVVRQALRDSYMGKSVSVYGWTMKAFWLLCKIAPHELLLLALKKETKNP